LARKQQQQQQQQQELGKEMSSNVIKCRVVSTHWPPQHFLVSVT
jgi:hypothetical protein